MDPIMEMLDFRNVDNVKDIFKIAIIQLYRGYSNNPFHTGTLKNETKEELDELININKNGFLTFDSQPTRQYPKYDNKSQKKLSTWYKRGYVMGILNEHLAWTLSTELSKKGKHVCIYNPRGSSHILKNGITKDWKDEDFTVTFCLWNDKNGNPRIHKYTHIWDYGSDIDTIKDYFSNKQVEKHILDHYVEICIVEPDFNSKESLIKVIDETLDTILNKN